MIDGGQFVLAVDFPLHFEKLNEHQFFLLWTFRNLLPKRTRLANNYSKETTAASPAQWTELITIFQGIIDFSLFENIFCVILFEESIELDDQRYLPLPLTIADNISDDEGTL